MVVGFDFDVSGGLVFILFDKMVKRWDWVMGEMSGEVIFLDVELVVLLVV